MIGAVIIDGTDIATLGVMMVRGGDHDFISFPSRKDPVLIDWPDEDGFEIGDFEPAYDAKKLTVNYLLTGNETNFLSRLNAFANLHFVAANNSIYVREFDTTFSLRFAGISSLDLSRGFTRTGEKRARISIDYIMDNPTQFLNPAITVPTANRTPDTKVEIGGVDLSAFGIIIKGVYPTALKQAPKDGIIYSSRYTTGQTVTFPSAVKKQKQNIALSCAMVCADRDEFMENWNALWNAVAVSSLSLGLTAAGKTYTAYYNDMSGFKKRPLGVKAKAEFEMNFMGYEV
ncbi:hypothetical protein [Maribellus mangrovi]|uniref:hypothetical protein n=1 Tax=Maribellus mangrovi TaxID=3133146 RepID=UPI0030ED46EC